MPTELKASFKRTPDAEYFGSITVQNYGNALNTTRHRFNVIGSKNDTHPLGVAKPEHNDNPDAEIFKIAVDKMYDLEHGEDY